MPDKIDKTDKAILDILQDDSRTSYRKISNALSLAVGTVYNRIKRLENDLIYSFMVGIEC